MLHGCWFLVSEAPFPLIGLRKQWKMVKIQAGSSLAIAAIQEVSQLMDSLSQSTIHSSFKANKRFLMKRKIKDTTPKNIKRDICGITKNSNDD